MSEETYLCNGKTFQLVIFTLFVICHNDNTLYIHIYPVPPSYFFDYSSPPTFLPANSLSIFGGGASPVKSKGGVALLKGYFLPI